VRSRLLLLIAIPTVTALALGGVRVASAVQSALAFQRAEERAVLAADITQLAQRLETERDQTVYYIALGGQGRAGWLNPADAPAAERGAPAAQYKVIQAFGRQTDQTVAQFRTQLAEFHGAYSSVAQQQVSAAVAGLDDLGYLRYAAAKTQLPLLVVVQKYAQLINNVLVIDDQAAQGTGDPVLSQTV
jgi:Nitrate and nitrite sensing